MSITPMQKNVHTPVGETVPTSVTRPVDCPQTLEDLITGGVTARSCWWANWYYIVEGSRRRVAVIEG